MSLILEALRKSEAERRLGQAPGLMTPMPMAHRRERSGFLIVVASVAVLLALGASLWWLMRAQVPPPIDAGAMVVGVEAPPTNSAPPSAPDSTASATVEADTPVPIAPVDTAQLGTTAKPSQIPPSNVAAGGEKIQTPSDPAFDSIERESVAVAAQASPEAIPDAAAIASSAPADTTTSLPSVEAPAVVAAAPEIEEQDLLPRLEQLPASERDALPPLKLSMHVYTELPADRFVLIDGRRYGEGAKLAASLQVVEIRRNGIVLEFNGRRFQLQRP